MQVVVNSTDEQKLCHTLTMKLIIGLGNTGERFHDTRHNIGFAVLDNLTNDWSQKPKFHAFISELTANDQKVILAKATTYYNLSGRATLAIKNFYKIDNNDILVIHDDVDLPFKTIRSRQGGSDAGNNGVKDIIANIGESFARIRIGVSNQHLPTQDTADFVLSRFSTDENKVVPLLLNSAKDLIFKFANNQLDNTSLKVEG